MHKRIGKPQLSLKSRGTAQPKPSLSLEYPVPYIELPCGRFRYRFYINGKKIAISPSGIKSDLFDDEVPASLRHIPQNLVSSIHVYNSSATFRMPSERNFQRRVDRELLDL